MSQMIDGPRKTFLAGETGGAFIRWYVSDASTSPPTVMIAGAAQPSIGASEAAVLATGPVSLLLANASGTRKLVANGVITGGNNAYAAADGEVSSTGTILEGTALETTTADGDILEVMGTFGEDVDEDWADDEVLEFGTNDDVNILWSTGDTDNQTFVVGLGDSNEAMHITDKAAIATNWDVAADTHPTVYIHSNTTPADDYVKIGVHNGTSCWLGDVVGGTAAFIGFDGLECLEFTETASAVNHVGIVNAATGNNPIIRAEGEADTGITFDNEAGEEILILDSVASSVNEITIASAATGNNPTIACTGEADTGITLQNAEGEEILILDSVATSVNELTIASAATGGAPSITASGGDTHVSLELSAKGTTGVVQVTDPMVEKMTLSATADTATITVAQLLTKILDATPTAAATYTLPTAANLVAGITDCKVGDSFSFYINNKGGAGDDITVAGGAGSTDDGILVTADGEMRQYLIVVTNVTGAAEAYLTYGIGTPAS